MRRNKNSCKLLVFVFSLLCSDFTHASKTDSLRSILKSHTDDKSFFETCLLLGNEFRSSSVDSALKYHQLAFRWAKEKLPSLYVLSAQNEIGYDKVKKNDLAAASELLRKANKELGLIAVDSTGRKKLNELIALNDQYLGYLLRKRDSLPEAMNFFDRSLSIALDEKNLAMQVDLYNQMAQTLYMLGSYPKSLDYCLRGLRVSEKRKDKQGIASGTGNAGILFKELGDYKKALQYFEAALGMARELKNKRSIAINLGNIGVAHDHLGNLDLAFKYYSDAAKIHEELGSDEGLIYNFNNIGLTYHKKKEEAKAIDYFNKALGFAEKIKDNYVISHTNIYLGQSYMAQGDYALARRYFDKAFDICQRLGALDLIQEYYQAESELYTKTGKFEKALESHKKYIEYKDSVVNEENLRKSLQLESSLKYEKKISEDSILHAKEILISNAEIEKKTAEIKADRNLQIGLYGSLGLSFVFMIFIYNRFQLTKQQKNIIHRQKELVEIKSNETESQKKLIEEKQKEIIDSINYARKIQFTLLAHDELLARNLNEYFVLFKPKDIVSGDFYWAIERETNNEKQFYLAICDSTGHGVPGAFMGLLNTSFLNEAISEKSISEPHKVFEHVRTRLMNSLAQDERQDGMDAILVKFSRGKNLLEYSASYNQPLVIRDKKLIEPAYDKIPIGRSEKMDAFRLYSIELQKGDMLYLYTDGYADQFGGDKGKKLKAAALKKTLLEISGRSASEQKRMLEEKFESWRGSHEQVDDVCVVGIRV